MVITSSLFLLVINEVNEKNKTILFKSIVHIFFESFFNRLSVKVKYLSRRLSAQIDNCLELSQSKSSITFGRNHFIGDTFENNGKEGDRALHIFIGCVDNHVSLASDNSRHGGQKVFDWKARIEKSETHTVETRGQQRATVLQLLQQYGHLGSRVNASVHDCRQVRQ